MSLSKLLMGVIGNRLNNLPAGKLKSINRSFLISLVIIFEFGKLKLVMHNPYSLHFSSTQVFTQKQDNFPAVKINPGFLAERVMTARNFDPTVFDIMFA